jgi:hypothetical protein
MEAHASTSAATVVQVETAVGAPAPQAASTSQSAAPPAEHLVLRLAPKKKQKKDRVSTVLSFRVWHYSARHGCLGALSRRAARSGRSPPARLARTSQGTVQWADDAVDNEFMGKKKSKSE